MKIIMHENSMDVAVAIEEELQTPTHWHVFGFWVNLGCTGKAWLIDNEPVNLSITRDAVAKWHDITDRVNLPRTKPGLP